MPGSVFDAPAYMMPRVKLFASGIYHQGTPWPAAKVMTVAANAHKLAALHVPPSRIGHEDTEGWRQWFDDRSDQPAAGMVDPTTIVARADPEYPGEVILTGDVVNIPPEMARRLANHEWNHGSAELYDQFVDDFNRPCGPALRRFSYLGADVPAVKRLGFLPAPVPMAALRQFAERRPVTIRSRRVVRGGHTLVFGEATKMDRTATYQAIQQALPGLSQAFLDALSDDLLAELAKSIPPADADADQMADDDTPMAPPRAAMATAQRMAEKLREPLRKIGKTPQQLVSTFSETYKRYGRKAAMHILGK